MVKLGMKLKVAKLNKILILFTVLVLVFAASAAAIVKDRKSPFRFLDKFLPRVSSLSQTVVNEENVVIDVVERVGKSVVSVSATTPRRQVIQFSPFGGISRGIQGGEEQDIGTGFIVSKDGLIVTNKHVVSDSTLTYKAVTSDGKSFQIKQISRDPNNDIAILKIDASGLDSVRLGDSGNLKVGQFVIAIGTALGEFRNTVTTGVISGLGRGISAESDFRGYVERLDDVIQTDAAINPGNSGGPLLNSVGEVIGVNVAVASGAQNIGFAIPINTVKSALQEFEKTGKFPAKAFLGIQYHMLSQQVALMNNVPQGAYITDVLKDSPAESAGVQIGDVIFKVNGQQVADVEDGLSKIISDHKVGDKLDMELWREGESITLSATLSEFSE